MWKVYLLAAVLVAPALVLSALGWGFDPVELRATRPLVHRNGGFAGAASCATCHPDHHASWRQTYHSTMTQRPTREAIAAPFDGSDVVFFGQVARPHVDANGTFAMDLPGPSGGRRIAKVAFTVGSHRYQQYFERVVGGVDGQAQFRRLPVLWHVQERRWLHINGIFLDPDRTAWPGPEDGAVWNVNCIFCHNTAPQPGMANYGRDGGSADMRFDSRVAELGIGCESCHGPGADHVAGMGNPLRRYRSYLGGNVELHVVDPKALDKERSVSVCGQCHGQRLPKHPSMMRTILETGPTFRSGDRLQDHVTAISRETTIADDKPAFALRFWSDGTPRLTAYEYQGVTGSPCYQRGKMTCESCHSMHGKNVAGQMKAGMRVRDAQHGNQSCLQCHAEIGKDVAAHTKHDTAGSGSRCTACHTPDMVYGVLGVRISHRIETPDAARDAAAGRPHACTMCHLDKSLRWAGAELRRMYGDQFEAPARRKDRAPIDLADSVASVLAGDPVQRVVYANALGRPDRAPGPQADAWVALLATLGDGYSSVRYQARKSLLAREDGPGSLGYRKDIAAFDPFGSLMPDRQPFVARMLASFPDRARKTLRPSPGQVIVRLDLQPDLEAIVRLLNLQDGKAISIGE
jgi:hypothetical protein